MSDNFSSAVQYLQENKDKYSLGELKEKLKSAGYSEDLVSEAEQDVFSGSSQKGNKIKDFFKGFFGVVLLVSLVCGIVVGVFSLFFGISEFIGLSIIIIIALLLFVAIIVAYFKIRKKKKYVARGILWGFFLYLLLVCLAVAFLIYLFIFWSW